MNFSFLHLLSKIRKFFFVSRALLNINTRFPSRTAAPLRFEICPIYKVVIIPWKPFKNMLALIHRMHFRVRCLVLRQQNGGDLRIFIWDLETSVTAGCWTAVTSAFLTYNLKFKQTTRPVQTPVIGGRGEYTSFYVSDSGLLILPLLCVIVVVEVVVVVGALSICRLYFQVSYLSQRQQCIVQESVVTYPLIIILLLLNPRAQCPLPKCQRFQCVRLTDWLER